MNNQFEVDLLRDSRQAITHVVFSLGLDTFRDNVVRFVIMTSSAILSKDSKFITVLSEPNMLMNKGREKDPCLTCESKHYALLY